MSISLSVKGTIKRVRNILVLVALDGSETSSNALRQAIRFAKQESCTVTALTVLPEYEGDLELGLMSNIRDSFRQPGVKILSEAGKIAKEEEAVIFTLLEEGNIHETIIDVAESRDCDLIIMGRSGMTMVEKAFMGSITARVIGYSPIDVLVMPSNSSLKFNNILLAIDGSRFSMIAAERAISLARVYGKTINLLSVVDVNEEFYANAPELVEKMIHEAREMVQSVEDIARSANLETQDFVREGEAHEKIVSLAKELDVDLICMGSHGRTGIRRLLMGSVTERVIGHAHCPVLVVKA
ncbi:MAG: universal stress protein [Actinomycetota bacterium]|nr:universal stress protein [Actinomycetota bacterium]